MFALAVWDSDSKTLHLTRDRFGEKPLYWGFISIFGSRTLFFASDLAAIFSIKSLSVNDLDMDSVHSYFTYGFVPAHKTIHKAFKQVMPGSFLLSGTIISFKIQLLAFCHLIPNCLLSDSTLIFLLTKQFPT